jgi:hypothetical protein
MFTKQKLLTFVLAIVCIMVIMVAFFMTDYSHLWWVWSK